MPRLLALCNTGLCLAIAVLMIGMGAGLVHYAHTRQALAHHATASAQLLAALPPEQAQQANFARDTLATVVRYSPAPSLLAVHVVDADATVVQQYPRQADASATWSPLADGWAVHSAAWPDEQSQGRVSVSYDTGLVPYLKSRSWGYWGACVAVLVLAVGAATSTRFRTAGASNPTQAQLARLQQLLPEPDLSDHPASDASPPPSLHMLLVRAEAYLAKVASERTVLNTSTKVLAYQKFNAESILRSIPDAVLVLDESGQVTFANQPFLRWYQLQDESIVGTMPTQWCSDPHMLGFLQRYEGQPARRAEVGNPQSDPAGKPGATLSMSAFPMFSSRDEKHISSTLIVFSDITTQVMAQKARDEFAAALAHELKTPLHSIGMHAELLLGEDGDDHGLRIESANYINTEVEHISELVRNMLNITRIETGSLSINRKLTKLGDLLNNAMDNLETTAREQGVTIRRQLPDTVEPSYLDKDLLRVAVNNLLSNAIKYNRQGGEVVVSLSENDSNLVLTIADTGIGISEDDKQHVFDKFFRSEDEQVRHRSGHGLGLSLVREIVELHNGTISVESAIGEGSEFTLRIKRISVPLQEAA